MALTVTKDQASVERISRNMGMLTGTIAFDSSYPTGGEALTGLSKYFKSLLRLSVQGEAGYVFEFDRPGNKLKVLYPQGGESTTAVDGSAVVDTGATAVTSSAANGAIVTVYAGRAREVANAVDLSTLTGVHFIAVGRI